MSQGLERNLYFLTGETRKMYIAPNQGWQKAFRGYPAISLFKKNVK